MIQEELNAIEHMCVALYGISPSACPVAKMYQWTLDWFTRFGCTPDRMNARINGKSNGMFKMFHKLDRKLRACDFAGVTSFSIQDLPDEFKNDNDDGPLRGQDMDVSYYPDKSRYLVCCIRESIVHERIGEFLNLAKQASEMLQPQYGIVYRRPFGSGPLPYAICLGWGPRLHPFDNNMTSWMFLMDHEAFAFLRDIYPWTILTQKQLDFKVGDTRLEEWIKDQPYRGKLSPFTDQTTLWTVPDESIPQLRDELWKAGVILDTKRDFDAKWLEYNRSQDEIAESYRTGIPLVHRPPSGISEEEMLRDVLGAFGGSESQVLKVEEGGKVRELTENELKEVKRKPKPKKQ